MQTDPWIIAFVGIVAFCLLIEIIVLIGMIVMGLRFRNQVRSAMTEVQRKTDPIIFRVNRLLETSEEKIGSIVTDAAEMTRVARNQAQKVDRLVTESLDRMHAQVIRTDTIITGVLETIEDVGVTFRKGFLGPLQQASAVLKGIRTGIDFIRGQRGAREDVQTDEELFI